MSLADFGMHRSSRASSHADHDLRIAAVRPGRSERPLPALLACGLANSALFSNVVEGLATDLLRALCEGSLSATDDSLGNVATTKALAVRVVTLQGASP